MKSTLRTLRILETVAEHQPVGLGDLAQMFQLPKSTVQRSLTTLADAGWLRVKKADGVRWELTPRALAVGRRSATETGLREAALGPMQWLRDTTDETIHLAVPDGLRSLVLVERMDSTQPVRTFIRLGAVTPLHATCTGRSVLAHLPEADVEQVIARGLESYSAQTITDPEQLRRDLRRTRRRGYAVNLCEFRPDVCAVGAAILDTDGLPTAGICISLPASRFRRRQIPGLGELVNKAAAEISTNLAQ
ncbi:MAG: IclR family transcriptional regulator [Streptosporangiaceae bacterium]